MEGERVPIFDINKYYNDKEQQDMLVRNEKLGRGLAVTFAEKVGGDFSTPDHNVVLMKRHGYTTHGADIETAVYRAIYTKINAAVQTQSAMLRQAFPQVSDKHLNFDFEPLSKKQSSGCSKMNEGTQDKPWKLWCAEVENSSLYVNRE